MPSPLLQRIFKKQITQGNIFITFCALNKAKGMGIHMGYTYEETNKLLKKAIRIDASIENRIKDYSSIEGEFPLFGARAKGAYIWDVDDNRFIDFTMGYGTILLGHADDRVNKAVVEEINRGTCLSPMWKNIQIELGESLQRVIPNAERTFFMKTGSDATSGAVRLARCFTGRDKILRWGYNGWHDWATPRPMGVPEVIQQDVKKFDYNSLEKLETYFSKYKNQIACVIMMPFETELPSPGYLQSVQNIAKRHGAVFILDEMRSGFRMAVGGAQEYFDIVPDLATYSKAMANGYPISAITGKAEIFEYINRTKMTATYFNSSHEMAAALKTIEIIETTDLIDYIWKLGELFKNEMQKLINQYSISAKMIGVAPMPYIEFDYGNTNEKIKRCFYGACAHQGILFHPNHHWYISGAHRKEDIYNTLEICQDAFKQIRR